MSGTPFPIDPVLTGIIIAYKNNTLIADQVLPRLTPNLPNKKFTWWRFDFGQFITVGDTKVGRKSTPNEVEFEAEDVEDKTDDYGLDDVIPLDDINNAPTGYDPRAFAAQKLIDLVCSIAKCAWPPSAEPGELWRRQQGDADRHGPVVASRCKADPADHRSGRCYDHAAE